MRMALSLVLIILISLLVVIGVYTTEANIFSKGAGELDDSSTQAGDVVGCVTSTFNPEKCEAFESGGEDSSDG